MSQASFLRNAPENMRQRILAGSIVLVLAFTSNVQPVLAQTWQECFAEGIKARDQGRWKDAEDWLRRAINKNPQATGEKVRVYGMKFERYIPYFYLGLALFHQGDCRNALTNFDRSRNEGAVGIGGRSTMKGPEKKCREKLGITPSPPPPPPPPSGPTRRSGGIRGNPPPPPPPPNRRNIRPRVKPSLPPPPAPGGQNPTTTFKPTPQPTRSNRRTRVQPPPPSPPTTPQRGRGTPRAQPPPPSPPVKVIDARREILGKKAQEVQEALRRAGEWAGRLDRHLDRTRHAAFRQDPELQKRYEAAYRKLNSARTRLHAGEREGDLQAVVKAGSQAEEARRELEKLAQELGLGS